MFNKKLIILTRRALCLLFYYAGHLVSIPMIRYDWQWLYPLYNKLMIWSNDISTKYDLGVWGTS